MSRPSLIPFLILSIIVVDRLPWTIHGQQSPFLTSVLGISDAGAQNRTGSTGTRTGRGGTPARQRPSRPPGSATVVRDDDGSPLNSIFPGTNFDPPAEPAPVGPRPVRGGQTGRQQQPVVVRPVATTPVASSGSSTGSGASTADVPARLPGTSGEVSPVVTDPAATSVGPILQSSQDVGGHVVEVRNESGPNGRQRSEMGFGDVQVTGGGSSRTGFEVALRDQLNCGPGSTDPHCSCDDRYNARQRLIWDSFQRSYGHAFRPAVGTSTTTNTLVSDGSRSIYSYSGSPQSGASNATSISRETVQQELMQARIDYDRCLNPCLSEGDARFLLQLVQRESDLILQEAQRRTPGARAPVEAPHEVTPELIQCQGTVNQYVCFDSNTEADVACRTRLATCMDNEECRTGLLSCRQRIGAFNLETYSYDSQYSGYMAQLDPEIQRIGDQLATYRRERDEATVQQQAAGTLRRTNVDPSYREAVASIQNRLEQTVVDGIRNRQYTASVWVPHGGQSSEGRCENMVVTKEFPAFYGLDLAFVIDNSLSMNDQPAEIVRPAGSDGSQQQVVENGVMAASRHLVSHTLPEVLAMTQRSRRFPPRILLTTQNLTDSPDMSLSIDTSDTSVDWGQRASQFLDHIFSSDPSVPHDNHEQPLMVVRDRIFREAGRFPRAAANLLLGVITDEPDSSFVDLATDTRIDAISNLAMGIQNFVQGQVSFFATRGPNDYDQNMSTFATALDRGINHQGRHFIGLGDPQAFHDEIMARIGDFVQPSATGNRRVNLDPPLEFALALSLVREGQEPLRIPSVALATQSATGGTATLDCRGHLPGAAPGTPAMERGCWSVVSGRGDQFFLSNGVLSPDESNSTRFVLTYLKHMPDNLITMMIRAPLRLPQPPRPSVAAQQGSAGTQASGGQPIPQTVVDALNRYGVPVAPVVTPPRARPVQRRRR